MMHTTTTDDVSPVSDEATGLGLRAWAVQLGWAQVSLLLLLAAPAFVLGAVSGGIYGATVCTIVWLALRMADEDAAWVERDISESRSRGSLASE